MIRIFFAILFTHFTLPAFTQQDTIAIENVNVIPMTKKVILYNQRVLIADGRIVKIENASAHSAHKVRFNIPAAGRFLIPGLSEMHYHFRSNDIESDLKLLIANGITTVRNMAEWPAQDHISIRSRTRSGSLPSVNYFTTGPYLTSKDISSVDQVIETVKTHKQRGYDYLKIADNLPLDIYLRLLEECQRNNLPVVGHAQRAQAVEYSLRMKSIEHIEEFLYLSDSAGHETFFKQPDSLLRDLASQIKASGVYIGTTLTVFDFINNCLDDAKFARLQQDSLTKFLAKAERENFLTEKNDYRKLRLKEFDGVKAPKLFADYFKWMKSFVRLLDKQNVPLLTGSDTYGMVIVGFSLHREFSLLQEAGIEPYNILFASTVNPAHYLGNYATEGTIEAGKNADLVLLDKNPLDDIRNTKSISGVFLKGKWMDRKELDAMLLQVEAAFK
jgi:imidazolonepropionase-like amidohydrolase